MLSPIITGSLVGYVSIGDNGKMVLPFREHLGLEGLCYVVHDLDPDAQGNSDPAANVERGSVGPVGEFVPIDYTRVETLRLPSGCADLVTMNQGLHHLPQARLPFFLAEVMRILRPSGLFIVREHDASEALIPMLDLAHSVFNAVTGVSARSERTEIRAFRPVLEWRKLIESAGFIDSMLYAMEAGDPTLDEMMCFVKPPFKPSPSEECEASRQRSKLSAGLVPVAPQLVPGPVQMAMNHGPMALIDMVRSALGALDGGLHGLEAFVDAQTNKLSSGQQFAVMSFTKGFFSTIKMFLQRFRPVLEHVQLRDSVESPFPLEELMLIVKSVLEKGERGTASANEVAAIAVIKDIQAMFNPSTPATTPVAENQDVNDIDDDDDDEFEDALDEQGRTTSGALQEPHPEATAIEIEALLTRLLALYPDMASPEFLTRAGFPARAQVALLGQLSSAPGETTTAAGLRQVSVGLCSKLDPTSFEEFSYAIAAIVDQGNVPPLTFAGFQEPGSPWWRVAMAVLGSKRVTFTARGLMMAAMVGLEPVTQMWQVARETRKQQERHALREQRRQELEGQGAALTHHTSAVIDSHTKQGLASALDWISDSVHTVCIPISSSGGADVETEARVLTDVKEIVEATIQVEQRQTTGQLLKERHDCTSFMRQMLHSGGSSDGAGGRRMSIGAQELDRVLEWIDLEVANTSPPVHEEPRRPYRFGDITRGVLSAVVAVAADISQPLVTSPARLTCVIRYSVQHAAEPDPDAYLPHVKVLLERCKRAGQLKELHGSDGEYTWVSFSRDTHAYLHTTSSVWFLVAFYAL